MPLETPAQPQPRKARNRLAPLALALAALLSACASTTPSNPSPPQAPVPAEWSTPAPYASSPTADAASLAALGGLIGIVLATGASIGLAGLMQVPYLFNPTVNVVSFVFSAGIGVLFGCFPARRAARMDPIEALRHE